MSNYIVDPMFFYWCNVLDMINQIIIIIFALCLIAIATFVIISWCENYKYDSLFEVPKFKKRLGILIAVTALFSLMMIFIPSKETLIEMEIARHATYENLDAVINKIIEVANSINK